MDSSRSGGLPMGGTYRQYKAKTARIVAWVVTETIKRRTMSVSQLSRTTRRKQKSRVEHINHHPSFRELLDYAGSVATYMKEDSVSVKDDVFMCLEDVIRGRKEAMQRYAMKGQTDRQADSSHAWAISTFEETFVLLGGLEWREKKACERKAGAEKLKKNSSAAEAEKLVNQFEGLEVAETKGWSSDENTPKTRKPKVDESWLPQGYVKKEKDKSTDYSLREDDSEQSKLAQREFAVHCFFEDIREIRGFVYACWDQLRYGSADVCSSANVSMAAYRLVERLGAELKYHYPELDSYGAVVSVVLPKLSTGENDEEKMRSPEYAQQVKDLMWEPGLFLSKWLLERGSTALGDYIRLPVGSQGVQNRMVADQAEWVVDYLQEISQHFRSSRTYAGAKENQHLEFGPLEDLWKLSPGYSTASKSRLHSVPVHVVYALAQLLDARACLHLSCYRAHKIPSSTMHDSDPAKYLNPPHSQAREKALHLQMKKFMCRLHNSWGAFRLNAQRRLDEIWMVPRPSANWWEAAAKVVAHTETVSQQGLWAMDPVSYGALLTSAAVMSYEKAVTVWEADHLLATVLHLYNAVLAGHDGSMQEYSVMEELCSVFNYRVFQGKRPKQRVFTFERNYHASYCVAIGASAANFAKEKKKIGKNQQQEIALAAKSPQDKEKRRCGENGLYALHRAEFKPYVEPAKSAVELRIDNEKESMGKKKGKKGFDDADLGNEDILDAIHCISFENLGYYWDIDQKGIAGRLNYLAIDCLLWRQYRDIVAAVVAYFNKLIADGEPEFVDLQRWWSDPLPIPKEFMLKLFFPMLTHYGDEVACHTIALAQEAMSAAIRAETESGDSGAGDIDWLKIPNPWDKIEKEDLKAEDFSVPDFVNGGGCLARLHEAGVCRCWNCFLEGVKRSQLRDAKEEVRKNIHADLDAALAEKQVPDNRDWMEWTEHRAEITLEVHRALRDAATDLIGSGSVKVTSDAKTSEKVVTINLAKRDKAVEALMPRIWEIAQRDVLHEMKQDFEVMPEKFAAKDSISEAPATPTSKKTSARSPGFKEDGGSPRVRGALETTDPSKDTPWPNIYKERVRKEDQPKKSPYTLEEELDSALFWQTFWGRGSPTVINVCSHCAAPEMDANPGVQVTRPEIIECDKQKWKHTGWRIGDHPQGKGVVAQKSIPKGDDETKKEQGQANNASASALPAPGRVEETATLTPKVMPKETDGANQQPGPGKNKKNKKKGNKGNKGNATVGPASDNQRQMASDGKEDQSLSTDQSKLNTSVKAMSKRKNEYEDGGQS